MDTMNGTRIKMKLYNIWSKNVLKMLVTKNGSFDDIYITSSDKEIPHGSRNFQKIYVWL